MKYLFSAAAVLLLAACSLDKAGDVSLDGTWRSEYDGYIINLNGNKLEYDDGGWGSGFDGTILEIVKFNSSGTAGIIFIEYGSKPVDYATGTEPAGNYIGIYFLDLTDTLGKFAAPAEETIGGFITPAKSSLAEAKSAFTEDTTGNYVSFWGTYLKQ